MNGKHHENSTPNANKSFDYSKGVPAVMFWGILLAIVIAIGWQGKINNEKNKAIYEENAKRLRDSIDIADKKIEEARSKLLR